jgi:hypothetical protein
MWYISQVSRFARPLVLALFVSMAVNPAFAGLLISRFDNVGQESCTVSPPSGDCPITLSFWSAVYDRTGGTASDPWGLAPRDVETNEPSAVSFQAGGGSPELDSEARYLYLYQFGQDSYEVLISQARIGFIGGQPLITSWGSFGESSFMEFGDTIITGHGASPVPGVHMTSAQVSKLPGYLEVHASITPNWVTYLFGFTSNKPPDFSSSAQAQFVGNWSGYDFEGFYSLHLTTSGFPTVNAGIPEPNTLMLIVPVLAGMGFRKWPKHGGSFRRSPFRRKSALP